MGVFKNALHPIKEDQAQEVEQNSDSSFSLMKSKAAPKEEDKIEQFIEKKIGDRNYQDLTNSEKLSLFSEYKAKKQATATDNLPAGRQDPGDPAKKDPPVPLKAVQQQSEQPSPTNQRPNKETPPLKKSAPKAKEGAQIMQEQKSLDSTAQR